LIHGGSDEASVPLASLTKIASVLTALSLRGDPDAYHLVSADDLAGSEYSRLRPGDEIRLADLIALALVSSDNGAAQSLAGACGLDRDSFVAEMGRTVAGLGIQGFSFSDPAGLSAGNKGTAAGIARLFAVAADNPVLAEAMSRPEFSLLSKAGRPIKAVTTNRLLGRKGGPVFGKTGFTNAAGGCFAGLWESGDRRFIVSVLGSADKNTRFSEAWSLAGWAAAVQP
jgi:D-alanyl-D-alanine endopeptidase (penicillin-binding protein 7)